MKDLEKNNLSFEEVYLNYENYIKKIVSNYTKDESQFEDIVQEANIALYNAYLTYNDELDITFKTYATKCIKNAIIHYLKQKINIIKVPTSFYYDESYQKISFKELSSIENDLIDDINDDIDDNQFILNNKIKKFISIQKEDLQYIINSYYFTDILEDKPTYDELACELNVTKQAIEQRISNFKNRLKKYLQQK